MPRLDLLPEDELHLVRVWLWVRADAGEEGVVDGVELLGRAWRRSILVYAGADDAVQHFGSLQRADIVEVWKDGRW